MWVEILKEMAVKNAEAEERAAQRAALSKWVNWIHDGQADGLRRQHQFSRTTQGWTTTKKSSGEVQHIDVDDELDQVEGLSIEDLNALKFDQAAGSPPATAQQQADDEAEAWHMQWGKGLADEPLVWPADMGEDLPRILREELIEAARTFPNHTGLGWDRLHPKSIERMSNGTVDLLVKTLLKCEEDGEWPEAVALGHHCTASQNRWRFQAHRTHAFPSASLVQGQATLCQGMGREELETLVVCRQG